MSYSLLIRQRLLQYRTPNILTKRHGYIVLVPEIGEDLPDKNPLLQQNGLPEFNSITIENCVAAIGKLTLEFEAGVRQLEIQIENQPPKDIFEEVLDPLEHLSSSLNTTWGLSKTLYLGNSSLMPTKSYLSIHERAKRARFTKFSSYPIYNAIKSNLLNSPPKSEEKIRIMNKFLLEGKLNGLDIKATDKSILDDCLYRLQNEKITFRSKIETLTKLFRHEIQDSQIVRSFPADLLKAMAKDPKDYLKGPWIATLQNNVYAPFLEYCPDRTLRWNIWQALVNRGSYINNRECATNGHLEAIRHLRRRQANLLGYESFMDMSMETKMAGNVSNVKNMLTELLSEALPAQEIEITKLYKFAVNNGFKQERLQLWDIPYWTRKHQLSTLNYMSEYKGDAFPLDKVMDGLFNLCHRLFNITITQRNDVSTWDKDVKYFDIFEQNSNEPIGGFYFDPYVRLSEKNNNGWMVGIQSRSCIANTKPLAALVFNFVPPRPNEQSFLTFKDVTALFNKFGYALQHLLTRATYSEVAGSTSIEWDAVDVCGHFLTHWLYNKSVIDSISNYENNEVFDQVRKHTPGLHLCRELYLSALDLELHHSKEYWYDITKNLWPQYRLFPLDNLDFHPCSFTQIFVEEYAAAYYSHIWAQVVAADIYSAFDEVHNDAEQTTEIGKRFRDTFLALGGSCHPNEVFRKFRGRDHSPKAFLSYLGLNQKDCGIKSK